MPIFAADMSAARSIATGRAKAVEAETWVASQGVALQVREASAV